jgi:hypothetical protein
MIIEKISPTEDILSIFESEKTAVEKLNWSFVTPEFMGHIDVKINHILNE